VVSRTCDHANGRLALSEDKSKAVCPSHGWCLDLEKLEYSNVAVTKKQLGFNVIGDQLNVDAVKPSLRIPDSAQFAGTEGAKVRFISHASVAIDIGGIRIVTDPWLLGPCFMTGWWHVVPPKADALDILESADLVYISHNHPDHMDRETLQWLVERCPDKPIIAPGFPTKSVVRPVSDMGFTNVIETPFNLLYRVENTPVVLSVFQSGDFRDDSGLFVASEDFSCLLTVDSAALNNMVLPKKVDLLCTAFAGGSSGFPWCFEHLSVEERIKIGQRFKGAVRGLATGYVQEAEPKAYMPYAGYFTEAAHRDAFIKEHNIKNSPDEMRDVMKRIAPDMSFIDPRETDVVVFDGKGGFSVSTIEADKLYEVNDEYVQQYIDAEEKGIEEFSIDVIKQYFANTRFKDDLILYLQPANDDFLPVGMGVKVDFSGDTPNVIAMSSDLLLSKYAEEPEPDHRKLLIKVRKNPLWQVIQKALPWEDLSIGFQCRIERHPDIYNSDFWFYFTNVYIGSAVAVAAAQDDSMASAS